MTDPVESGPSNAQPIRDGLRFFGTFLRRPGRVGAVLPSSRYLADALVGELAHLRAGDLVVEYGPGTGPMTQVIRQRMPEGARYLGIEREPRFIALLQGRFPDLQFHEGSAGDLAAIIQHRDLPWPKRIVSGIPFASLPGPVQDAIVESTAECLAVDGEFRTFQYVHAYGLPAARRFRAIMREHFKGFERSRAVVRNVPPAFVLRYWGAH